MPEGALQQQQQRLTALRQDILQRWPAAQELTPAAVQMRFPARAGLIAGWRLLDCMQEEPGELLVFVDKEFPWSLPLVALPTATNGISVPHLERDGNFCLTPSGASYALPVGVGHLESLVSDAEDVLRQGRTHTNDADFLSEAHSYWSLLGESAAQVWLTRPAPASHELWVGMFAGADWAVGPDKAALTDWVKNSGRPIPTAGPCIVLRLESPLYPRHYPRTAADFLRFAQSVGAQTIVVQAMRQWKGKHPLPFVLVFAHAGNDICLAGMLLSPFTVKLPGARGTGIPGFRKNGRVHPRAVAQVPGDFPHLKGVPVYRQYLTTRTAGAIPELLSDAHIVIAGCGAIGGELAVQLAKAGIGEMTLLDSEVFDWRNVGRHVLDGTAVGRNKALAVQGHIQRSIPDAKVTAYPTRWQHLTVQQHAAVQRADLVIAVTGEASGNLHLDSLNATSDMPAVLFGFTEAFAVAGHAILQLAGSGRLKALTNEFGVLREPVAHISPEQRLPQEPSCGAFYQPYSSLAALATIHLIGELAIDALLGKVGTSTHRVWVGSVDVFGNNGLSMSEPWRRRINNAGDNRRFSFVVPPTE